MPYYPAPCHLSKLPTPLFLTWTPATHSGLCSSLIMQVILSFQNLTCCFSTWGDCPQNISKLTPPLQVFAQTSLSEGYLDPRISNTCASHTSLFQSLLSSSPSFVLLVPRWSSSDVLPNPLTHHDYC